MYYPLNHGKVRAEILLLCCAEILPFWASCRNITGQEPWLLESHAGPFLGRVKKYWFLGEIFTSAWGAPPLADFTDFVTRFLTPSLRGCGQSKADLLEEHPGLPGMPGASKKNVKIIG